jgi:hypothetical protein
VNDALKIARERFVHEIELKELDLQIEREKRVSELLQDPIVFYTVCILGSSGIAWLTAVLAKTSASDGDDTVKWDAILKKAAWFVAGGGGATGFVLEEWMTSDGSWIEKLLKGAGAGGTIYFASMLALHEIFGGSGQQSGPGGIAQMLGMLGVAL